MATPDTREVLDFLQALLAGGAAFDRTDPAHVAHLQAACALIEEHQSIQGLVPGIAQSGQKLQAIEGGLLADSEGLLQKIGLLEELYVAVDGHLGGLRRRAAGGPEPELPEVPAEPYEGVVAIDIGTSGVAVAHWDPRAGEPEVAVLEPVAVNVLDAASFPRLAPGSFLVGEAALTHPSSINLYRSFRRFLGHEQQARPAVTGTELVQVQVRTLVAALVDALLKRLARHLGRERLRFPQVMVTVPASGDLAMEHELRRALEGLKLPSSTAVDEAMAACVHYLLRPVVARDFAHRRADGATSTPGEWYSKELGVAPRTDAKPGTLAIDATVLCVDTGGGTTDLALLEFSLQQGGGACQIQLDVKDTTGFPDLSGEGLTLHLFELLKRRLALALLHPRRALLGKAAGDAPPPEHPWRDYHRNEAGPHDPTVAARLDEDRRLILERWDQVAGGAPLRDALRAAVDRAFPTVSKGAPKAGRRHRQANFRWLWDEAERIKRHVSDERAALASTREEDDPLPTVRGRLDLTSCPRTPGGPDVAAWIDAAGGVREPDALAVACRDIDRWVEAHAEAHLRTSIARLTRGAPVHRVLLAGAGTHATRYVVEPFLRQELSLEPGQVVFEPDEAKKAVARGACLWAIGRSLEGIEVFLEREPRVPGTLWLLSAVGNEVLFEGGEPIRRFGYAQPPHREGDQGDKLILIGQDSGGRLEPLLMFDPRKGTPVLAVGDLPILRRRDVVVKNVDALLQFDQKGGRHEFFPKDPGAYHSTDDGLVSQWELVDRLREEMTMEEVIAWIESAEHLKIEPPPDHAFHRYYLDETRELYLVFHARGKKLLCRGQVTRQSRHGLPEELDPFSGVH